MKLVAGEIYHVYNRGINKQPVFSSDENYIYFVQKLRRCLLLVSDILCYCPYSSFSDYVSLRNGTLCNKQMAGEQLGLNAGDIYKETYQALSKDKLKKLML